MLITTNLRSSTNFGSITFTIELFPFIMLHANILCFLYSRKRKVVYIKIFNKYIIIVRGPQIEVFALKVFLPNLFQYEEKLKTALVY